MDRTTIATALGPLTIVVDAHRVRDIGWYDGQTSDSRPPDNAILREATSQLDAYFAGRLTRFDLPLALDGSDHERRVWAAMQDIPHGQTASYADVARTVGSAPRAVGRACGRNRIAVVIPCHRVIAAGGGLGGYSGGRGLATKQALLDLERRSEEKRPAKGGLV